MGDTTEKTATVEQQTLPQESQDGESHQETTPSSQDGHPYENCTFFFGMQGKRLRTMTSVAGGLGFLLFGYDQGVLGGLNASENFLDQFDNPSSSLLGTINAIYE